MAYSIIFESSNIGGVNEHPLDSMAFFFWSFQHMTVTEDPNK